MFIQHPTGKPGLTQPDRDVFQLREEVEIGRNRPGLCGATAGCPLTSCSPSMVASRRARTVSVPARASASRRARVLGSSMRASSISTFFGIASSDVRTASSTSSGSERMRRRRSPRPSTSRAPPLPRLRPALLADQTLQPPRLLDRRQVDSLQVLDQRSDLGIALVLDRQDRAPAVGTAARQRRSPATMIQRAVPVGSRRTRIGWSCPCSAIVAASSASSASSNLLRACSDQARCARPVPRRCGETGSRAPRARSTPHRSARSQLPRIGEAAGHVPRPSHAPSRSRALSASPAASGCRQRSPPPADRRPNGLRPGETSSAILPLRAA